MPQIDIQGVGTVDVDPRFLELTPQQQAAEVDAIVAHVRSAPVAKAAATGAAGGGASADIQESGWMQKEAQANLRADALLRAQEGAPAGETPAAAPGIVEGLTQIGTGTGKDDLKTRGAVLPVGTTQEGKTVWAIPGFAVAFGQAFKEAVETGRDLMTGTRTIEEMTPAEVLNVGLLAAGAGPATGTGKGVAAAAGERAAARAERTVTEPRVMTAGEVQALKEAPAPAATPPAAPTAPAPKPAVDRDVRVMGVPVSKTEQAMEVATQRARMAADDALASGNKVLADELGARATKLETLQGAVERARASGKPFASAVSEEFRVLARDKALMSEFTAREQQFIKIIAQGRGVTEKAVRQGAQASLREGIGVPKLVAAVAHPAGFAAAAAGGEVAQVAAAALIKRNLRELTELLGDTGRLASTANARRQLLSKAGNVVDEDR